MLTLLLAACNVWVFDATATSTIQVSADTVSRNTASDLAFYVNGPDTCTLAEADDNYDCTFTPAAYSCPSLEILAEEDGTHEVVIFAWGSCNGRAAEYSLVVNVSP